MLPCTHTRNGTSVVNIICILPEARNHPSNLLVFPLLLDNCASSQEHDLQLHDSAQAIAVELASHRHHVLLPCLILLAVVLQLVAAVRY
jgi:hypothetical protein